MNISLKSNKLSPKFDKNPTKFTFCPIKIYIPAIIANDIAPDNSPIIIKGDGDSSLIQLVLPIKTY